MLAREGDRAVFVGIRRDEQATRAKERIVSPRSLDGSWDVHEQPPEFWGYYADRDPARRARPRPSAAGLDRNRRVALHPARRDSDRAALSGARRNALPLPRGEEHHPADRQQRGDDRRDHRRTRRPRANPSAPGARWTTKPRPRSSACAPGGTCEPRRARGRSRPRRPRKIDADRAAASRHGFAAGRADRGGRREQPAPRAATEWSFALDALQDERDQAVTIDTTRVWFKLGGAGSRSSTRRGTKSSSPTR